LSTNLPVYESIVGSCFNIYNCAYFHDWFDFILSSDYHVVSRFLAKVCLHTWNNWVKNWKVTFVCQTAWLNLM